MHCNVCFTEIMNSTCLLSPTVPHGLHSSPGVTLRIMKLNRLIEWVYSNGLVLSRSKGSIRNIRLSPNPVFLSGHKLKLVIFLGKSLGNLTCKRRAWKSKQKYKKSADYYTRRAHCSHKTRVPYLTLSPTPSGQLLGCNKRVVSHLAGSHLCGEASKAKKHFLFFVFKS